MRRIFSLLVAVCLVAGGLLAGPTTAQAAPPAARLLPMKAKVPAATVKPAAIPGKKVATKKSTATLKPRYTKTSTAKVVSARITVKKGGKTVARNKASYKAKPGTYTVTQVVKYRKAAKTKVDKKTGKVTVTAWAKKQYTVTKTNKVKVTVSPPKKLANTTKPSIKGTAQPGNLLTADRGKWSGSGIGYTYEWLRDGTPIPNSAYRPTYYRPTFADLGRKISVRVTATTKKDVRSATSKAVTVAPPKKKVQACGASTYADFAAGGDFGLVLSAAGEVCGWGENALGQLGTTTADYQAKPVKVQVPKAKAVAAGNGHGLALTTAGDVWAWGHNESGQLGIDDPKKLVPSDCAECHQVGVPLLFAPRKVAGLPKIASIVAVGDTSVAVAADGSVYVWGDSRIFPAPVTYPRKLSGISGAAKVVTDGERYLALTRSGTMLQWGLWVVGYRQPDGSVSTPSAQGGELVYQKAPATAKKVSVEGKVVDVAMPDYAAYALTDTGKVYAWGTGGGLGRLLPVLTWPDSRVVAKPTLWKKLPAAKAIFAGGDSAIAELKDGRVVLWGEPGDWDGHDHRKYASSPLGDSGASVITSPRLTPSAVDFGGDWLGGLTTTGSYTGLFAYAYDGYPLRTSGHQRGSVAFKKLSIDEAAKKGCSNSYFADIRADIPVVQTVRQDYDHRWMEPYTYQSLSLPGWDAMPSMGGAGTDCSGTFTVKVTVKTTTAWTWKPDGKSWTKTATRKWK